MRAKASSLIPRFVLPMVSALLVVGCTGATGEQREEQGRGNSATNLLSPPPTHRANLKDPFDNSSTTQAPAPPPPSPDLPDLKNPFAQSGEVWAEREPAAIVDPWADPPRPHTGGASPNLKDPFRSDSGPDEDVDSGKLVDPFGHSPAPGPDPGAQVLDPWSDTQPKAGPERERERKRNSETTSPNLKDPFR